MTTRRIDLVICCTDRGQHSETVLGDLSMEPARAGRKSGSARQNLLRANLAYAYDGTTAGRRKDECVWLDDIAQDREDFRVHLWCPRCRREIQWRGARATELLDQFKAADIRRLDISLIP